MSGHSKWSSIKHKKALTDAKKAKVFSKISRMISVAVRERGPDPATNTALRLTIEKARGVNMPAENIERAIKKFSGKEGEDLQPVQFEAYGPGGVALIIDAITDSRNRTSQEMKHLLSEHGGTLASPGSVLWMFKKQGKLQIKIEGGDKERVELAAIESGAEDIAEENGMLVLITKPDDLHLVQKRLEEKGFVVEGMEFDFTATNRVAVPTAEKKKQMEALYEALDENDDVQEFYSNTKE